VLGQFRNLLLGQQVEMSQHERKSLIVSFSELNRSDDDHLQEFATADETFLNQNIFSYALDEVHAMMQIMCCNLRLVANCYNPLYLVLFLVLFIIISPGALLHRALMCCSCISVRKLESPEERELRSQGIYAALGLAIISMIFGAIGLNIGQDEMFIVNMISLYVNASIIISSLIGLKAVGEELMYTIRTFAIGAWVILLFIIGLCLVDAYMYLTFHWLTAVSYVLRLFAIFIYGIVAVQCISLWNSYKSRKEIICIDIMLASFLALIYTGIVVGFVMAIVKSEQNAWRIIYF